MKLHFIEPGKPVQNAFIESFNGKFREECLSQNWVTNLDHARREIAVWRHDYNNRVRPHKSLGWETPAEIERAALDLPRQPQAMTRRQCAATWTTRSLTPQLAKLPNS